MSPPLVATSVGFEEVVERMVRLGADVGFRSGFRRGTTDYSALELALYVLHRFSVDDEKTSSFQRIIVSLMQAESMDMNGPFIRLKYSYGASSTFPVVIAWEWGLRDIVDMIIKHTSFNINHHSNPLFEACILGDLELVRFLEQRFGRPQSQIVDFIYLVESQISIICSETEKLRAIEKPNLEKVRSNDDLQERICTIVQYLRNGDNNSNGVASASAPAAPFPASAPKAVAPAPKTVAPALKTPKTLKTAAPKTVAPASKTAAPAPNAAAASIKTASLSKNSRGGSVRLKSVDPNAAVYSKLKTAESRESVEYFAKMIRDKWQPKVAKGSKKSSGNADASFDVYVERMILRTKKWT